MNSVMTTFKWKKTDDMQIFVEESTKELADIFVVYSCEGALVIDYWKQVTEPTDKTISLDDLCLLYIAYKKMRILFRMKKQEILLKSGDKLLIPFYGHTVVVKGNKDKCIEIFE